ncbi:MAG: CHASE2 domain-containing protein, partial [Nitrospirota bacterium]|nr:CHASE2 domain-containing protein [Nitrospirota bacterium]
MIAAAYINPLNLTASSDRASQDVFFRYMAPLYGEKNQPITIIVLDDEYLVRTDSSWPIPYRTLTKFLQTIYCVEPKAIFIDLVFTHLHSSQNSLDRFVGHLNPGVHPETVREIVDDCQSFDNGDYGGSIAPVFIADFAPQKDFA